MEIRDYLRVLRNQWKLILACVLLAAGLAALLTVRATPQYRATVKFFVSTPTDTANTAYTGGLFSQQRAKSYADIVAGPATADAVARTLTDTSPQAVRGRITGSVVPDTVLLQAAVIDTSPKRTLDIARGVAATFPGVVKQLEAASDGGQAPVRVSVVEEPELPTTKYAPRPVRNLGLAVVLGLLVGVGLAVLRETLDNTLKTQEDVLAATGVVTLGAVGFDTGAAKRPLIVADNPRSARAEAFRQLRTNLQFVEVDGALRSFVITSSVPGEGKSTTACNLAITLAQAGASVCLVEGDLRRPRIADYLGKGDEIGLTSVLIGQATLEQAMRPWGDGALQVLASGPIPPNPSELLSSRGMADVLHALEASFDVVVIDAPPLLPVTDAAILAALAGGAVLVTRVGSTRSQQLALAVGALRAVDAKVLGVVLNMVPSRGPDASGSYGYGAYESDGSRPQMSAEDAARALRSPVDKHARSVDREVASLEPRA